MILHSFTFFFFNDTATTEIYTLSLHDALPIFAKAPARYVSNRQIPKWPPSWLPRTTSRFRAVSSASFANTNPESSDGRSEEHTSELQSPCNLVCRLLLEKKKK